MFLSSMPQNFIGIVLYILENDYTLYLSGIKFTIIIAFMGTFFGLVISLFLTVLRIQKRETRDTIMKVFGKRVSSILATSYVEFFRGTPMIVQAMIFYYGLAMMGIRLELIVAGVIVVSLNTAAYLSEVLRAGINSIDKGQMEAARSLGMSKSSGYRYVIFPQVLKNMVPAIGNELVVNIKDTAVLSVIGVGELFYMGRSIAGTYYRYTESFVIVAFIYLVIVLVTTRLLNFIVKKMNQPGRVNIGSETRFEG